MYVPALSNILICCSVGDGLEIECKQVVQMLEGNILAPYAFLKVNFKRTHLSLLVLTLIFLIIGI